MWTLNRTRNLVKTGETRNRGVEKARRAFHPAPDRLETREVLATIPGLSSLSPTFVNPLLNLNRNVTTVSTFPSVGSNNGVAANTILNFNRAFAPAGAANNVNPNLLLNAGRFVNNSLTNGFSQAQFFNSNPGGLSNGFGATTGLAFNQGLGGVGFSNGNNGFGATSGLAFNNNLGGTNFGSSPNSFGAGAAAGLAANNGLGGVFIGSPGTTSVTTGGLTGTNSVTANNGFGAASGLLFNNGSGGTNFGTTGNGLGTSTGLAFNNPFSMFAAANRFSTGFAF